MEIVKRWQYLWDEEKLIVITAVAVIL